MNPLISIIVPVYNVSPYLAKCLDSIQAQSYEKYEVIIVDDGSTDQSGIICDSYEKMNKNWTVIHKKNGGLSSARNSALEYVHGDFIMYIDSDDWVESSCLCECVKILEKEPNVDCVMFPYKREFENNSRLTCPLGKTYRVFSKSSEVHDLHRRFFGLVSKELDNPLDIDRLNMAWGKLYRWRKVRDIRFISAQIIGAAEDCAYNAQAFLKMKKIVYTPVIQYHYNKINDTSILHKYSRSRVQTVLNLHDFLKKQIEINKLDRSYCEALKNRQAISLLNLVRNVMHSTLSYKSKAIECRRIVNEPSISEALIELPLGNLPGKWRLYYWFGRKKCVYPLMCMTQIAEYLNQYWHN